MNNGNTNARTEPSQLKPPTTPHWAIDAGFESYVTACRSGIIPANRPTFIGKSLAVWQIKWLLGLSDPSKAAKRKSQARDRRGKRKAAQVQESLSLAGSFATRKAVR